MKSLSLAVMLCLGGGLITNANATSNKTSGAQLFRSCDSLAQNGVDYNAHLDLYYFKASKTYTAVVSTKQGPVLFEVKDIVVGKSRFDGSVLLENRQKKFEFAEDSSHVASVILRGFNPIVVTCRVP